MNLNEFKNDFELKINSYPLKWTRDDRMLHLMEEVGEFSEIIMQYKKLKTPYKDKEDIKNAIADIFDDLFALALLYDIDFESIYYEVLKND